MTTTTIAQTALFPKPPARRLEGKDVGVTVRRVDLPFDGLPTFWFGGNAFLSMFLTGFSSNLPVGEAQFIHSVRLFQHKITNPVLQAQVRAFIGQEAIHAAEHDTFNKTMTERGLPLNANDAKKAALTKWVRKHISPEQQLASTVCAEHLTALISDAFLSKCPDLIEKMSPQARKMWVWHFIEETEHKAVAFDVYEQVVGDRKRLRRTMAVLTFFFFTADFLYPLYLMTKTGQMTNWKMWREAFSTIRRMVRASKSEYWDFYKVDFHPWQHNNLSALKEARVKYLGEGA